MLGILLASCVAPSFGHAQDLPAPATIRGALTADRSSIDIHVTVTNPGNQATSAARLEIYLSSDGLVDAADHRVETRALPPLPAHADRVVDVATRVPPLTPGRYYVLARVAPAGDEGSASPGRTLWGAPLALGPDLTVDEPVGAIEGETVRVRARAWNRGTSASDSSQLAVFWIGREPTTGTAQPLGGLAAGDSTDVDVTLALGDLPAGKYQIGIEIDPAREIAESEETNNTARGTTDYPAGPDLTVRSLSGEASAGAIVVDDTVRNQGNRESAPCGVSFFLSRNGLLDAGDIALGYRVVPRLDPGAESSAETRLPLPDGTATGRYFLLGKVDSSRAVDESDERNNLTLAATPIDLRIAQ
ncbi:MAG: CARDB domain-containing protein [Nitrospiria bacterium]